MYLVMKRSSRELPHKGREITDDKIIINDDMNLDNTH